MRKWMPAVLIALSLCAALLAWWQLPARVAVDFSQLLPFSGTAEESGRAIVFVFPAIALAIWLAFSFGRSALGTRMQKWLFSRWAPAEVLEPAAFERFRATYDTVVNLVIAFIVVFQLLTIGLALGGPPWLVRGFSLLVGIGMAALGNIMPRFRPNPIMGVRTRTTLNDPRNWARTHRVLGACFMIAGIIMIALTFIYPRYAFLAGMAGLLLACVVAFVYSTSLSADPRTKLLVTLLALIAVRASGAQAQTRPDSIPPAGVVETNASFTRGSLTLNGTLTMPARVSAPIPVVVIVVGSGPTDRNGNGPLTSTNVYRFLAWQLAQHDIASFRYDKRGIGPGSDKLDHTKLVIGDFVDDVTAAARMLSSDGRFNRVFLFGHSEGAQLVLQSANSGAPVAGVIMASGLGRSLGEALHDQFALQMDSATLLRADTAFARFLRDADDSSADVPQLARMVLQPVYRNFLRSMAAYDPTAELARLKLPLAFVQAAFDLQATPADAARLRAARPDATVIDLKNANHVLKQISTKDITAQTVTYHDPSLPIVPQLAPALASWLKQQSQQSK